MFSLLIVVPEDEKSCKAGCRFQLAPCMRARMCAGTHACAAACVPVEACSFCSFALCSWLKAHWKEKAVLVSALGLQAWRSRDLVALAVWGRALCEVCRDTFPADGSPKELAEDAGIA